MGDHRANESEGRQGLSGVRWVAKDADVGVHLMPIDKNGAALHGPRLLDLGDLVGFQGEPDLVMGFCRRITCRQLKVEGGRHWDLSQRLK
jgi:hypothetical protein